jgi:hypothetical protein
VLALLFGINEKNHGFISFHGYGCFLLAWPRTSPQVCDNGHT